MLAAKCPGQDRRNWKPEDIFEHECPHCGSWIEFWKTDAKRTCAACHEQVINPKFNLGCALWCAYADQCVGDISSIFMQRPEALKDRLQIEARRYFKDDLERFQLTEEAARIASSLLETEKEADPPVIIAATLLHDVGYPLCQGEGTGEQPEEQARCIREKSKTVAEEIMKDLTLPQGVREKALDLISGESSRDAEDLNLQLWQDILEIARLKQEKGAVDAKPSEGAKPSETELKALRQKLGSENARKRLEQLL